MKKSIGLIFVLLLSFSILTACGGGSDVDVPPTNTGDSKTGNEGTTDEIKTVKIILKDFLPGDENTILFTEKINEGLKAEGKNIQVEFLDSPVGTYKEAVPLAIRTGQIEADLIYFQGGEDELVKEGFLEDLTPYIENSVNIKNLMQAHNEIRMKNYIYLLWLAPARSVVPAMRSDYFEQLDIKDEFLANPSSENYKKVFLELKEKGLAEFGLTADGDTSRFDSIFNHAFGVNTYFTKNADGKWISYMMTENEKNKLAFYAELYAEGLIDPDYLTNQWDSMEQNFYDNRAGLIAGTAGGTTQIYNDKSIAANGPGAKLVILPPAKGISQAYGSIDNSKESRGFALHADSLVKDEAMAVLEFMAGPEGRMLDKLGIEGVHYTIEDNKIQVTDKFTEWWSPIWDTFNKFDPGMEYVETPFADVIFESLDAAEEYSYQDIKVAVTGDASVTWDAIKNEYNEFSADVIRGVRSIDEFDAYVESCYALGADQISDYLAGILD